MSEQDQTVDLHRRTTAMAPWHPDCYQRAVAFVTDPAGRLLVFDHLDVEAGTQVPAGGIHVGESAEDAVRREVAEESGIADAVIVRKLGESWNRSEPGNVPDGLEEQILHVFHLGLAEPTADERWDWEEVEHGEIIHRFAFRWIGISVSSFANDARHATSRGSGDRASRSRRRRVSLPTLRRGRPRRLD